MVKVNKGQAGYGQNRRLLMCPPTYYDVAYSINPWMDVQRRPEESLAWRQWEALRQACEEWLRMPTLTIEPQPGLPDMVFTANAGLAQGRRFIVSRFRYPQRQPESQHFAAWFAAAGYEVLWPPPTALFEGVGEARFCGQRILAGYGQRSNLEGHAFLAQTLGVEVISLELVDPRFYHLDLALCVLGEGAVMAYLGAFRPQSQARLLAAVPEVIAVDEEEALRFACNCVVAGRRVLMPAGATLLPQRLGELGYEVKQLNLSEFLKAGGGARCLTLDLL